MSEIKKLAVVLGGWHYPYAYYKQVVDQKIPDGWECDYFVVSHRDPELPTVFEEKQALLKTRGDGLLQSFDKEMYSHIVTKKEPPFLLSKLKVELIKGVLSFKCIASSFLTPQELAPLPSTIHANFLFIFSILTQVVVL